eukprot:TRINITY_DN1943_c0_g1_i2.p1 TRINITY_DN1943_c0_g1~~TRINITY_DN1943_c0_g1_i2.p1  ORF type:complete len:531 (+),score=245.93 TRINITY_DN1943_c0_g1_i2:80-1594(+)
MAKRASEGAAPAAKRAAADPESVCLSNSLMPELGKAKKGKVRDIYFTGDHVLMVATDRVSAFDHVLDNLIPYKGELLNRIAEFNFRRTEDIVPNALVASPDPNVVVQKKMKNLMVECIVRGYVWGSMAAAYEKGKTEICGLKLPGNLLRFQKLDEPLFTPTTKAEEGPDENMTFAEVAAKIGKERAEEVKRISLALYQRGNEIANKAGLVLIDTKYEFGLDEKGVLHLIDEVNTPDSSRLCNIKELEEKWPQIKSAMAPGSGFKNVSECLAKMPHLKITEFSKQYVRDLLLEKGFKPGGKIPKLSPAEVAECTSRYVQVYERITGETFVPSPPGALPAEKRLVANLQSAGFIKGCCCMIFAGSDSDLGHMEKIAKALEGWGVPSQKRVCSAHKQPARLEAVLQMYNTSIEPLVIVGCAGGTDALSGTASYSSVWPVVSCPPDGENESCLRNPPGSSNAYCRRPDNVAKFAAQALSCHNPAIRATLIKKSQDKVAALEKADSLLW